MPRNSFLNEVEKVKIDVLKKQGVSKRQIAIKIGRSDKVVRNYLRLGCKYGINNKKGNNTKVTKRQIGQIKDLATKQKMTAAKIVSELQLPIKKRQVQNILSKCEYIKWKKPCRKPALKPHHKAARLEFAKKHMAMGDKWKSVVFSDEKKFNLDGPDGLSHYWHDLRHNDPPRLSRNFGGGNVMVWAAFSFEAKTPICFITNRMNSECYTELLDAVLIPFLEDFMDENAVFQQDNASIHASRHTKNWLNERNVSVLDWPACSPDLNPIENLWGYLARKVYENGRQFSNLSSLKVEIKNCWRSIPQSMLQNLILSMESRIFSVISQNGGETKY